MTIKHHIAISATITLALIAIVACQEKAKETKTPKIKETVTAVVEQVKEATPAAENKEKETNQEVNKEIEEINEVMKETEKQVEDTLKEVEGVPSIPKNFLQNGDFNEGLKGWLSTKGVKVIEEEGRKCVELLGLENDQIRIWQNINTTSGHVYRLTFNAKALQDTAFAIFRDNVTGEEKYLVIDPLDDWNKHSWSFVSKRNGTYGVLLSCRGKGKFYYSDISLIDVTTSESRQK